MPHKSPEERKAYHHAYYEKTKEMRRQKERENKDELAKKRREWSDEVKEKVRIRQLNYRSSPSGVLRTIFLSQKLSCQKRGHSMPEYTAEEFIAKFVNDPEFLALHDQWLKNGMVNTNKPSLDRIDNSKGYSFDNIRLTTWDENRRNAHVTNRKTVLAMKEGVVVAEFPSVEATVAYYKVDRMTIRRGRAVKLGLEFVTL